MQTIRDVVSAIVDALKNVVDKNEANNLALLLFNHLKGYSRTDLLIKADEIPTDNETLFIAEAVERLKQSEPIQYVLGKTEFMGMTLEVDKNVLIPRPETEELVEWILNETGGKRLTVLDIGTGSGCISCAIKKHAPHSIVKAWDISENALIVAKKNAWLNNVQIEFESVDILNHMYNNESFDVIISNPPYITEKEKILMQRNVLNYEPHSALFVPDNKPLLFYDAIADFSFKALNPAGMLFFEINEAFGDETVKLLKNKGFKSVELRKDISDKDRMVKGIKN